MSFVEMCLCEEEFGFTKDALVRRAFGAVPGSLMNCTPEQREKYLYPVVRGDINVALGMTEPGEQPNSFRNSRSRWLWSQKPVSVAVATTFHSPVSINWRARCIRQRRTYLIGGMPVAALNIRLK